MYPSTHFEQVYGCSNVYNGLGRDGVDGDKLNPNTITANRHAIKEPFFYRNTIASSGYKRLLTAYRFI